jgi:hypothetical protein
VGAGVGVEVGVGLARATPLFQTSFLPLLIHVNFLPLEVVVRPTFLQDVPAWTTAFAFIGVRKRANTAMATIALFIEPE